MAANYSYYAIPASYLIAYVPHVVSRSLQSRAVNGRVGNANPRSAASWDNLKQKMSAADYAKFERARAAHANGLENFPADAITLMAGSLAGLPASTLNAVAVALVLLKLVYMTLYINTTTNQNSLWRSLVWITSRITCVVIMFQSASAMSRRP